MTEAEWLCETTRPVLLVDHTTRSLSRTNAGRRKLRLFACAAARLVWDVLPDDRLRAAVEVAERVADRRATGADLAAARVAVAGLAADGGPYGKSFAAVRVAVDVAVATTDSRASAAAFTVATRNFRQLDQPEEEVGSAYLCRLLRSIFGNPFRPVTPDPRWLTTPVVTLAATMYDTRDFAPMPILADALEEAGCEDAGVLDHCRGGGPHARGCWVVDLVLGKG